ncbi:MAG: hypothetical protein J4432_00100 [DPANN group archaeon]|nr:hypothetical protein [DPANN group archaeon]
MAKKEDSCFKCGKLITKKGFTKDALKFCSPECIEKYEKDPKVCEFC